MNSLQCSAVFLRAFVVGQYVRVVDVFERARVDVEAIAHL